uniref:Uncharacterized protein n=1 Tax=Tetraodon nigroviridis TaxID=99883 RepID=H3D8U8_TETNG
TETMASMLSEELLLCPICLDVLNLPISTPCGHNFCKACIQGYWEAAELSQCPVCKQKLSRGSEFKVNTLISELASQFRKLSEKRGDCGSSCVDGCSSQKDAVEVFKKHNRNKPKMTKTSVSKKLRALFSNAKDTTVCQVDSLIKDRLQWINEINQTVEISRENAARETQDCLQIFQKLLQIVQKGQADLLEDIDAKQRQVELKAREMVVDLEQEMDALMRERAAGLPQCPVSSTPPAQRACLETAVFVGTVSGALTRVAGELQETVKVTVRRLYESEIQRARQYAVDVTLDPDTAHPKLILSENRKQVHHGDVALSLPDNPKRFYPGVSVLGREGFSSGRFYYEVLVKGKTEWDVGVGLETITRKGGNMLNPENGYWALGMRGGQSYWALSSTPVCVPLLEKLHRVGVYVDMEWGQVLFYNVDAPSLIYSFTGYSFRQRLFPYFNPRRNQNGTNSAPLIIPPVD